MRLAVNDEELEKVAFEANRRRRNGGLRKKTRPLSAGGKSQRRAYAVKRKMKQAYVGTSVSKYVIGSLRTARRVSPYGFNGITGAARRGS